jgi:UDP-sulfoquinovose synthase
VSVYNQITETHRVADLAELVAKLTGADIAHLPNPRREAVANELVVANDGLVRLGLEPTTLSVGLVEEIADIAERYRHRVDPSKIVARSVWRKGMETADDLMVNPVSSADAGHS